MFSLPPHTSGERQPFRPVWLRSAFSAPPPPPRRFWKALTSSQWKLALLACRTRDLNGVRVEEPVFLRRRCGCCSLWIGTSMLAGFGNVTMAQNVQSVTLSLTLPITCHICLGKVMAPALVMQPRRDPWGVKPAPSPLPFYSGGGAWFMMEFLLWKDLFPHFGLLACLFIRSWMVLLFL